jgi:hypothetical protein
MIDTVGNKGTISAKLKDRSMPRVNYEIGVEIQLSSSGLTKIIKLTPYYLLINNTDVIHDEALRFRYLILKNNLFLVVLSSFWRSKRSWMIKIDQIRNKKRRVNLWNQKRSYHFGRRPTMLPITKKFKSEL